MKHPEAGDQHLMASAVVVRQKMWAVDLSLVQHSAPLSVSAYGTPRRTTCSSRILPEVT